MILIYILVILVAALLGGFFYACRGGQLSLGSTQAARILFWALPDALLFAGVSWYLDANGTWIFVSSGLSFIAAFLGLIIFNHGEYQDGLRGVGLYPDNQKNISVMWAGRLFLFSLCIGFMAPLFYALPLAAPLFGLEYQLGWKYLYKYSFHLPVQEKPFVGEPTGWGEFLNGNTFAALIVIIAIISKIWSLLCI